MSASSTVQVLPLREDPLREDLMVQNFIGVPLVFGQTTYFFQNAGLRDAFLASLIISIIGLVSLGCSIYLIERLGRRTLVLWGAAVMIVCDLLIGDLGIPTITPGLGSGLITLSSIWMFAYQTSLGPIGQFLSRVLMLCCVLTERQDGRLL
jgi:hypothetical protein